MGLYHAIIIGGIYNLGDVVVPRSPESYFYMLYCCIRNLPYLGVVTCDTHTDRPFFRSVPTIDLGDHISIVDASGDERDDLVIIEEFLAQNLDVPFRPEIPRWRVIVLVLQSSRCFVAFSYSHSTGDGVSGTAFHRVFFTAWLSNWDGRLSVPQLQETDPTPLPPPFDTPERLPISWSFLLKPLVASRTPKFIADWLGIRAHSAPMGDGTWTGAPSSADYRNTHSRVVLRAIAAPVLEDALRVSRLHGTKLTGTLQQLIARAMSQAITDPKFTNFVAQTAVNMRRAVGQGDEVMGEFVSGCFSIHQRTDCSSSNSLSAAEWKDAVEATKLLAETASRLEDQPVGLLRYAASVRGWVASKIGDRMDCSYEVSNVGSFDPDAVALAGGMVGNEVRVENMVFAQPGHVISAPLAFSFVSVKGGSMMYTVSWRNGALGIAERDERGFVEGICSSIASSFEALRQELPATA